LTSGFDGRLSRGLQTHHHSGWQHVGQLGQARGDAQLNRIQPARGLKKRPMHGECL
jgi:hypothetical protein